MPELERKKLPALGARNAKGLQLLRATEPAKSAFRARRLAARMFEIANDLQQAPADRIGATKAMLACQDQLLEWLAVPKRPAARTGERPAIPVEAVEAILAPVPGDLPTDLAAE